MLRWICLTLCCGLFTPSTRARDATEWTNDQLLARVLTLAEKLQSEYAAEKEKNAGDLETWNKLEYYADKLRNRVFVRSRDKKLSAQKSADLQWLARESEIRAYNMRSRETAAL